MKEIELIEDSVFLLNKYSDVDFFFQGYCFIEQDYIFGLEGALKYKKERDMEITAGEDGSYVFVKRIGDEVTVGNDFYGYRKFFYYHSQDYWAVSNSLYELAVHLQELGIRLTPNYGQLNAIKDAKAFRNQLFSKFTAINEIKLAPMGVSLVFKGDKLSFSLVQKDSINNEKSYESLLEKYLYVWCSRFLTLMEGGIKISCDLTGGRDSRAVFSLFQYSRSVLKNNMERNEKIRINCGQIGGQDDSDREIAREICDFLGLKLNGPSFTKKEDRLDIKQSFEKWRAMNLGSYHPIYFTQRKAIPDQVSFGGGAAGNFRPFYSLFMKEDSFIKDVSKTYSDDSFLQYQIEEELEETMAYLQGVQGNFLPPLILHYMNFRNRLHVGRPTESIVTFMPLGSKYLHDLAYHSGLERIQSGQIMFDIIYNMVPDLLNFPYDKENKKPTEKNIDNLCKINIDKTKIAAGSVFYDTSKFDTFDGASNKDFNKEALIILLSNFKQEMNKDFVVKFWGKSFIAETKKTLEKAVERGRFTHATEGNNISAILVSGLFFNNLH